MKIFKVLLADSDPESSGKARSYLLKAIDNIDVIVSTDSSGRIDFQGVKRIDLAVFSDCTALGASRKTLLALRNFNPPVQVIIVFDKLCRKNMDDYLHLGIDRFIIKDNNYYSALNEAVVWAIKRLSEKTGTREPIAKAEPEIFEEPVTQNPVKNHEINNLLMTIIGSVHVLLARPDVKSERLILKLKTIEESARMIARITGENLGILEEHSTVY